MRDRRTSPSEERKDSRWGSANWTATGARGRGTEAPAGEVWPHTLLCGRRRRLRQLESWNNRTCEYEDEVDGGRRKGRGAGTAEQRIAVLEKGTSRRQDGLKEIRN
ncbi:hypothetical protein KM043_011643 [Ampulex compressa]|nr:hypothetical protein KM043_011643 [Ampulex compressa]